MGPCAPSGAHPGSREPDGRPERREGPGRAPADPGALPARPGEFPVDEAAADLGVPPGQIVTRPKVLLMCGLPGGYPDDYIEVDLDALEGPEARRASSA